MAPGRRCCLPSANDTKVANGAGHAPRPRATRARQELFLAVELALDAAPMAGATASHSPMVTTIDVK